MGRERQKREIEREKRERDRKRDLETEKRVQQSVLISRHGVVAWTTNRSLSSKSAKVIALVPTHTAVIVQSFALVQQNKQSVQLQLVVFVWVCFCVFD